MKVLYITNVPAPYRVEFFNELSKLCQLTVVYESRKSKERNADWTALADDGYESVFLRGLSVRADARCCPGILKYIKRDKYDVIVVGGYATPTAMLAISKLRRKKIPFFLNADGGFIPENESASKRRVKCKYIGGASWWLSTGEMTNEYFVNYGAGKERIFEYPFTSVRDTEIPLSPIPEDLKLTIRGRKALRCETLVVIVSRFIPEKGIYEFLETWLSEDRGSIGLAVIGGGPEEDMYKKLTADSPNVWILPFLKKDVLADYYRAADVFVLPTTGDAWGLVINEAMSHGLPVFSTKRCIAAETMKGTGIYTFPAGNNRALIFALMKYAKSENKEAVRNAVLKKAREYTIEKMAKRHIEIFEETLSGV